MDKKWSLKGRFDSAARTSFFGMALAIYIALETFSTHGYRYKISMSVLVIASGLYIAKKALAAQSILGVVTAAFTLVWLLPFINENIFFNVDLTFMLAHSALALLVAVGAFSYLKS